MNAPQPPAADWNVVQRIAFRLFFCYFVLYLTFDLLALALGWQLQVLVNRMFGTFMVPLVLWVGTHILHLQTALDPAPYLRADSDTAFEYVLIFTLALLAVIATVVWTLADRHRKEYRALRDGLRLYMRYVLAFVMLSYGMIKVIKTQFPFPSLEDLYRTYGRSTPKDLLWLFMGYSTPYTFFAGAGEVLGGMLLFFRRTMTLGALVTATVMLQVVMLDYSYNVSVKIESAHLLLMAVILAVPDLRRLVDMLVLNRATAPADLGPVPRSRRMRVAAIGLKPLLIVFAVAVATKDSWGLFRQQQDARRIPIYGVYNVEEFRLNGQVLPPLATDSVRWSKVMFDSRTHVSVMPMNGSVLTFSARLDFDKRTITASPRDPRDSSTLVYSRPDSNHIILTGRFWDDTIAVKLKKVDESRLPLLRSKFRWLE